MKPLETRDSFSDENSLSKTPLCEYYFSITNATPRANDYHY